MEMVGYDSRSCIARIAVWYPLAPSPAMTAVAALGTNEL
jgi:hypothetical protein